MLTVSVLSVMLGLRTAIFYDKQLITYMNINRAESWNLICSLKKDKTGTLSHSLSLPSISLLLFLLFFPPLFHSDHISATNISLVRPLWLGIEHTFVQNRKKQHRHTLKALCICRETACVYLINMFMNLISCSENAIWVYCGPWRPTKTTHLTQFTTLVTSIEFLAVYK